MRGVGRGSWLKGEVVFGLRSSISGLKLGDAGKSTHNRRGASNTTFTACRFRGGGGSDVNAPVIMLGLSQNSCDHITFTDCICERNLVSEQRGGFNNVSITAGPGSGGATVDYITFTGCHFGVSNGSGGHDTGSPIANIECTTPGTSATYHNGYSHITVDGCVFEITDWFNLDFSCSRIRSTSTLSAHDIIVTDNLFKGAGYTARSATTSASNCPTTCSSPAIPSGEALGRYSSSRIIRVNTTEATSSSQETPSSLTTTTA